MAPLRKSTGALGDPKSKMKQGNLFSFFTKKAEKTSSASKAPPPASSTAKPEASKPAQASKQVTKRVSVKVGDRIEVFWPDDDAYYPATVTKQRGDEDDSNFYLEYDDGQCEWIDLAGEKYRQISQKPNKRRRIQQDDEDDDTEQEFEMDDAESEGSAYVQKDAPEDEDDDDDQWMVTDDEDDRELSNKKPKKTLKVTNHTNNTNKTPAKTTSASKAAATARATPKRVTPALGAQKLSSSSSQKQTPVLSRPSLAVSPGSVPMYTKGAVNPAGSHVHHHLKFLQNPRDAQGRTRDHPDYDCRTLKLDIKDWDKHCGKMTNAVKQWWDLKSQYFDTVLLFKTGKFYELFHMDADVGVQVCGLLYMKGHVAHAGFPEISYGQMADKLVRAGYKVARVEQTETPEMLKARKKKHKGKDSPKVVNREVCSILTLGTRTFCYLDAGTGILQENSSTGVGPLLAIREVLCEASNADSDSEMVQPVCEYGITLVDAVHGSVTIGQFADDVLRSRMDTLLAAFGPSEILLQGGENGASETLESLIRSAQKSTLQGCRVEIVRQVESFPKSTAVDPLVRRKMERISSNVHPWDVEETLKELHRRQYYPRASKKQEDKFSVSRWPQVLRAAVEGRAELAISSFGAALYYLQRNLIDSEILSMGIVKAYIPPVSSAAASEDKAREISHLAAQLSRQESGLAEQPRSTGMPPSGTDTSSGAASMEFSQCQSLDLEEEINHMSLDGTTLHNLEILHNSVDHKVAGSLWSKINHSKTPHGARLLRAWLLRPLFRKTDIERRADAVEELVSGGAAVALSEATSVLAKCGDIERLLSRVHSMSGSSGSADEEESTSSYHPNDRAILYETGTYTKRKVGDFSKVLNGLRHATQIPELFNGIEIQSGLLRKLVRHSDEGGCFPSMTEELDWFYDNFDCEKAAKGLFEPSKGIDELHDEAVDSILRIEAELNDYKDEMCSNELSPRSLARSSWKYINTMPESKDKYLIELPASVTVPDDFIMKGKRGSGHKQVNKYRTAVVEQLVGELERALDVQKERKARGLQLIFAKFDSMRTLWAAAAQATAILDALGSLAQTSKLAGYTRPKFLDCPPEGDPGMRVIQGRHPCIEDTFTSSEYVPNDLLMGSKSTDSSRVLLLSGPNMAGKSSLLRQTCLIAIMAQIGCFVPAVECELTPMDRIYTRLGASDRILLGQSTFFVELAETAAALRGASRRSLVIMDELGRGTSTFDGTAIASAAVQHLVQRCKCISLFATHYHSLLDEWKGKPNVRLGHMECIVENGQVTSRSEEETEDSTITFLYTLGEGACPKSFGVNVARLAGLPKEVLANAKRISSEFEDEMNTETAKSKIVTARSAPIHKDRIMNAIRSGNWAELPDIWQSLQ